MADSAYFTSRERELAKDCNHQGSEKTNNRVRLKGAVFRNTEKKKYIRRCDTAIVWKENRFELVFFLQKLGR